MNRKPFVTVLSLAAVILVACGGGGTTAPNIDALVLDQTYVEDGISFKYPNGWVVDGVEGGQIFIASNQAALEKTQTGEDNPSLTAGELVIAVLSLDAETALMLQVTTPFEAVHTLTDSIGISDGTPQFGEPSEITVAGKSAAKAVGTGTWTDGEIIAIAMGDVGYAIVYGISANGELPQLESTVDSVAATLTISDE